MLRKTLCSAKNNFHSLFSFIYIGNHQFASVWEQVCAKKKKKNKIVLKFFFKIYKMYLHFFILVVIYHSQLEKKVRKKKYKKLHALHKIFVKVRF